LRISGSTAEDISSTDAFVESHAKRLAKIKLESRNSLGISVGIYM